MRDMTLSLGASSLITGVAIASLGLMVACSSDGGSDDAGANPSTGGSVNSGGTGTGGTGTGATGTGGTGTGATGTGGTGTGSTVGTAGDCGTGVVAANPGDPNCVDVAPDAQSTCGQQAAWGKCTEAWMTGKCLASCGKCVAPPPVFPACQFCRPTKFSAGMNLAWFTFSGDVPNPSIPLWDEAGTNLNAAGGQVIRWWLHVNGANTPGYDAKGLSKPITEQQLGDLIKILNSAKDKGVSIVITLWSFDMLQTGSMHPAGEASDIANNTALLTVDANRQAYIDNYLTPLVKAIKGHPALYGWDIFNEPEGMVEGMGWTPTRVPMVAVQKTVNWLADAIHQEAPGALVTSSAQTFRTCSTATGFDNKYSDTALTTVGGRAQGKLDFYQVHFYAQNGDAVSPFLHPATYWGLDKPLVIGEFWAMDTNAVPQDNLYTHLYDNGYDGAWAWQYYNSDTVNNKPADHKWPAMKAGLTALHAAHAADLDLICK